MPLVDSVVIGVAIDRDERRRRITARLHQRLDHGMVEEMRRLLDSGVKAEDLTYYGLEYKYVTEYVIGQAQLRRDGAPTGDCHPPVCQAPDDVVSRHGAPRHGHPLGRRHAADGGKSEESGRDLSLSKQVNTLLSPYNHLAHKDSFFFMGLHYATLYGIE